MRYQLQLALVISLLIIMWGIAGGLIKRDINNTESKEKDRDNRIIEIEKELREIKK